MSVFPFDFKYKTHCAPRYLAVTTPVVWVCCLIAAYAQASIGEHYRIAFIGNMVLSAIVAAFATVSLHAHHYQRIRELGLFRYGLPPIPFKGARLARLMTFLLVWTIPWAATVAVYRCDFSVFLAILLGMLIGPEVVFCYLSEQYVDYWQSKYPQLTFSHRSYLKHDIKDIT